MTSTTPQTSYALRTIPGYSGSTPGIQIGTYLFDPTFTDEDLQFLQQLGVEWAMVIMHGPPETQTLERYLRTRDRLETWGIKMYRIGNHNLLNMDQVTLNLPGREAKIAEYVAFLRNLQKVGVHYNTYGHMANGIWTTGTARMRGGVEARMMDLNNCYATWEGRTFKGPLTHGRVYEEDELWENYTSFIRQIAPVAEETQVFIGIHPDDPPVYPLGGVPRTLFGTMAGYKRALTIANSPNIGVCLCVGCWLEGGPAGMGVDVIEAIRTFAGMGKLFKVHFRNISQPMPAAWTETFIDNGYMDMHKVMRTLHEVGFDGCAIPDHVPVMLGGRRTGEAYSVAYMRALIQAVQAEG